jgi:hypothetical protein
MRSLFVLAVVLLVATPGCAAATTPKDRDIVTATPVDIGISSRFCVAVRFRVQLIGAASSPNPDYKDVRLTLAAGHLRVPATGTDVPAVRRHDLELPERVR